MRHLVDELVGSVERDPQTGQLCVVLSWEAPADAEEYALLIPLAAAPVRDRPGAGRRPYQDHRRSDGSFDRPAHGPLR
jgi:hypothetical protein